MRWLLVLLMLIGAAPAMAFDLQGHRGARGLFPENTLEGFAATEALGVASIELDVALTADGIAVVTHDSRLNPDIVRGPDGAWLPATGPAIRALTLAELRRYDVGRLRPGSRIATLYPDQAPHDGARIPTLADTFARTAAGTLIDAEIKTDPTQPELTATPGELADAVVVAARAAGALGRLVVRSFDWRGLHHMQAHYPDVPLVWLTSALSVGNPALWWDGAAGTAAHGGSTPRTVAAAGGAIWAPDYTDLTQAQIAEARALGLRVLPWTVNDSADMARLMSWGVDGICTDRPDRALPLMRAAGL